MALVVVALVVNLIICEYNHEKIVLGVDRVSAAATRLKEGIVKRGPFRHVVHFKAGQWTRSHRGIGAPYHRWYPRRRSGQARVAKEP